MDSEDMNNNTLIANNFARIELLGKLNSVFDQFTPFDKITATNASSKMQAINSMRSQDKTIVHLT